MFCIEAVTLFNLPHHDGQSQDNASSEDPPKSERKHLDSEYSVLPPLTRFVLICLSPEDSMI